MIRILMVCLGNICRSPMAEGILRKKAEDRGIIIEIDSAGFESYHAGERPDPRAVLTAQKHDVDILGIRSRVFRYDDFKHFDKIYVMDKYNYSDVMEEAKTEEDRRKVDFILNTVFPNQNKSVPDPYYGGINGFENVFNLLENACDAIIAQISVQNINGKL